MSDRSIEEIIAHHTDSMQNLSLYLGRLGDLMGALNQQVKMIEVHLRSLDNRITQLESSSHQEPC